MPKLISRMLLWLTLLSLLLGSSAVLLSCQPKGPEETAPDFSSQITLTVEDNPTKEKGSVSFTVSNPTEKDCCILGPLGNSMLMALIPGERDKFYNVANSTDYDSPEIQERILSDCSEIGGRYYFTVPAGESRTFTLPLDWFAWMDYGTYLIHINFTDSVENGVFRYSLECKFTLN